MTKCAKVFCKIIQDICWIKGWKTNGYTERFPHLDGTENELQWLVDNGYLFYFTKRNTHSRYKIANNYLSQMYGITAKGWNIAEKYVDNYNISLNYQMPYYPRREK